MFKKIALLASLLYAAAAMAAVDVNKATAAELDGIRGVGPSTSKLIVDERKKAEFKNWSDFMARIKGVGPARATKLSEAGLTVGGASYQPAAKSAVKPTAAAKP